MEKGKKYSYQIQQGTAGWEAQIIRQVTSRKVMTTKKQAGFSSEAKALEWAEQELTGLVATQASRNERRDNERKQQEQERLERSQHRTEKTRERKEEQLGAVASPSSDSDESSDEDSDDWGDELRAITAADK